MIKHRRSAMPRLSRVLTTGVDELIDRGRQEVSKRLDKIRDSDRHWRPRVSELDRAVRSLHIAGATRFFRGATDAAVPGRLCANEPDHVRDILAKADDVLRKRFDLLGYSDLFFGDPVDWHLDPVSGRRAPKVHWSQIRFLDQSAVGDSKVIWELNRHQWMVTLGQAYRLTGSDRYAEAIIESHRAWAKANPPGYGINWASSLEVAYRLIAWSWAIFLIRDSRCLSPAVLRDILAGIYAHARHVERYLSYYFSPNTHLTGEALGLFYAGVLFPEFRRARRWCRLGTDILVREAERQVLPDGVYFEQSTWYQRYTIETYLHFMILAARNGRSVPISVQKRVTAMLEFLLAVRRPDGSMPQIGDADGGYLLPLAGRPVENFSAVFAVGAVVLRNREIAWAAEAAEAEVLWLLGDEGVRDLRELEGRQPVSRPSRLFPDGRYAVMRNSWERTAHHLIFDVGPLGCPRSAGHGHADLLSIQCSIFGEPYIVDPGTFCYTADAGGRAFFRGTFAHSTVVVDGVPQAEPAGPFQWRTRPAARPLRWISTDTADIAEGEHDAYAVLPEPVRHRRRVVFVKSGYWVVIDDLEGRGEHEIALGFQFAPMAVLVDTGLWVRATRGQASALLVGAFAQARLKVEVLEGQQDPARGWMSVNYGHRQPAPRLVYSVMAPLPLRILTLLLPLRHVSDPIPEVRPIPDSVWGLRGLRQNDREAIEVTDDGEIVISEA